MTDRIWCFVFGWAHWDLTFDFVLLQNSVVCTVECLSLFISFLYLDLFVLGDDASMSQGCFMWSNIYVSWSTSE